MRASYNSALDGTFDIFTPVPDPGVDLVFMPKLRRLPSWSSRVPLTTNSAGMRYPREFTAKAADVYRVVILGDSFVAAEASPFEDGVAPQLEHMLRAAWKPGAAAAPRVEVYPVAVSGWNLFSELRFLLHNLHRLDPDLVIHAVCENDVDGGSGIVLGNLRSSLYDLQGDFGPSHISIASPSYALGTKLPYRSLLGSGLIPESRTRYVRAIEQLHWVRERLQSDLDARYLLYFIDRIVAYGMTRADPELVEKSHAILSPPGVASNSLLPVDGHPNREGYRLMARAMAERLEQAGILPLDRGRLQALGASEGFWQVDGQTVNETIVRQWTEVDKVPPGFRIEGTKFIPEEGPRCIVGGVYLGAVLSPRAVFVLRGEPALDTLRMQLSFPDLPALVGRRMKVFVDAVERQVLDMSGNPTLELELGQRSSDLVEITFESDGYWTDLAQSWEDGVFPGVPQAGRVLFLELVGD